MAIFRILSFDGGGIRGALTAGLLKRLNERYPQLIAKTDLFAGTSTGSIIALGLAYGLDIEDVADLYSVKNSKAIFSCKGLGLFRPKYSLRNLEKLLLKVFPRDLRLYDLKKYIVVPSFRVRGTKTKGWSPVFFNNFPDSNTKDISVIDAALCSSSAPIYFPSYNQHIDGGVIANNPSVAALSLAVDPYYANQVYDEVSLLSIGTGFDLNEIKGDTTKWGLLKWLLNSNPPLPLETILLDGAVETDSYFSYQFLKNRFYRLNPLLNKTIPLDDYQQIPYLISLAEEYDLRETFTWLDKYWLNDYLAPQSSSKEAVDLYRAKYWHNLHNIFYK